MANVTNPSLTVTFNGVTRFRNLNYLDKEFTVTENLETEVYLKDTDGLISIPVTQVGTPKKLMIIPQEGKKVSITLVLNDSDDVYADFEYVLPVQGVFILDTTIVFAGWLRAIKLSTTEIDTISCQVRVYGV